MELILKQDVDNLGFTEDIVTVKNGYGRNYLIPRGKAVLATESAKKSLAETMRQRAHKEAKLIEEAKKTAAKLKDIEIQIPAKVGKNNKLFGSVSNIDLADALAGQGFKIDKKYIQIAGGNIRAAGPYQANIRLHREVHVDFDFEVIPEKKK